MLRQVYIIQEVNFLYERDFGKSIDKDSFRNLFDQIKREAFKGDESNADSYDYYKYRISYITENKYRLIFIFITGLTDDFERVRQELEKLKREFLNLFGDILSEGTLDRSMLEVINPIIDKIHRNLKPKISLVGFSGVGKTTITRLIKAEEIPMEHVPTITGDVATIKIGKLHFYLWDFAGQEQFSFLWNKFIKGSDAVLIITDSTLENVEKSKFFLELINDEVPNAHTAIIGNKQDLPDALHVEKIEELLGLKTYSMIAIDPNNRDKMIKIIADVLEMSSEVSPLLKPLFERDQLISEAQYALENGDFQKAAEYFERIGDLCLDLGDDSLGKEFYEKSEKLKNVIKSSI
ncbi:MAG: ADP-ribosylation factor-like protein [Promethearchaeota archaeon]